MSNASHLRRIEASELRVRTHEPAFSIGMTYTLGAIDWE